MDCPNCPRLIIKYKVAMKFDNYFTFGAPGGDRPEQFPNDTPSSFKDVASILGPKQALVLFAMKRQTKVQSGWLNFFNNLCYDSNIQVERINTAKMIAQWLLKSSSPLQRESLSPNTVESQSQTIKKTSKPSPGNRSQNEPSNAQVAQKRRKNYVRLNERMKQSILHLLEQDPDISNNQISTRFGISLGTTKNFLKTVFVQKARTEMRRTIKQ